MAAPATTLKLKAAHKRKRQKHNKDGDAGELTPVDCILSRRTKDDGTVEYKVRWEDGEEDWLPKDQLLREVYDLVWRFENSLPEVDQQLPEFQVIRILEERPNFMGGDPFYLTEYEGGERSWQPKKNFMVGGVMTAALMDYLNYPSNIDGDTDNDITHMNKMELLLKHIQSPIPIVTVQVVVENEKDGQLYHQLFSALSLYKPNIRMLPFAVMDWKKPVPKADITIIVVHGALKRSKGKFITKDGEITVDQLCALTPVTKMRVAIQCGLDVDLIEPIRLCTITAAKSNGSYDLLLNTVLAPLNAKPQFPIGCIPPKERPEFATDEKTPNKANKGFASTVASAYDPPLSASSSSSSSSSFAVPVVHSSSSSSSSAVPLKSVGNFEKQNEPMGGVLFVDPKGRDMYAADIGPVLNMMISMWAGCESNWFEALTRANPSIKHHLQFWWVDEGIVYSAKRLRTCPMCPKGKRLQCTKAKHPKLSCPNCHFSYVYLSLASS